VRTQTDKIVGRITLVAVVLVVAAGLFHAASIVGSLAADHGPVDGDVVYPSGSAAWGLPL
jgi:hypothetical protein